MTNVGGLPFTPSAGTDHGMTEQLGGCQGGNPSQSRKGAVVDTHGSYSLSRGSGLKVPDRESVPGRPSRSLKEKEVAGETMLQRKHRGGANPQVKGPTEGWGHHRGWLLSVCTEGEKNNSGAEEKQGGKKLLKEEGEK